MARPQNRMSEAGYLNCRVPDEILSSGWLRYVQGSA